MNMSTVVVALLTALYFPTAASAFEFRTIALTGQPATGLADGLTLNTIREPLINESGDAAFDASLAGPGVIYTNPSNAYTLWRWEAGVLTNIARSGEHAAGLPADVKYNLLSTPRIDGQGRVAFYANAPGDSTDGIFSEGQGALRLVARETDQVPGLAPGVTFNILSLVPLMNERGHVAFTSFIRGPGLPAITEALFSDRDGPLNVIAREGDPVPGIGTLFRLNSPVLNDQGVIAFSGRNEAGSSAIWTETAGTMAVVVKSGDALPGPPAGITFDGVGAPRINNAGQVLFHSTLAGPGITASDDDALWVYDAGNLHLIGRESAPAPGVLSGVNLAGFTRYYLNGAGEATFTGALAGPGVNGQNDTALWSQHNGALELIAREGDQAPGAPAGVTFGDFTPLGGSLGFQVNKASQVAFEVTLTGPGVTADNDQGIWVTDPTGVLRLLAREGDAFDVNDDPSIEEWRTIHFTELGWYSGGGEDGFGSSFNNSGQLAFALSFTDFTQGAFIVNTAIPEPASAALLAVALAAFICVRRR